MLGKVLCNILRLAQFMLFVTHNILLLKIFRDRLLDVNKPISCLLRLASFRILPNFLLTRFSDIDVAVLPPFLLKPVKNIRVVVPARSVTVMDTYRMEVVRQLLHLLDPVNRVNFGL